MLKVLNIVKINHSDFECQQCGNIAEYSVINGANTYNTLYKGICNHGVYCISCIKQAGYIIKEKK